MPDPVPFTREDVRDSVNRSLPYHITKVNDFKNDLNGDPLYAFTYGDEVIRAAACIRVMNFLIKDIDNGVPLKTIVEQLHDRIMDMASFGRRSTSVMDNHSHLEELAATTEMHKMVQAFYKASDEYEA